ncbi:hypothetical protein CWB96_06440, partial [Pseudoalteromonas citrea]
HTGSLEKLGLNLIWLFNLHCHAGSLESGKECSTVALLVHCRTDCSGALWTLKLVQGDEGWLRFIYARHKALPTSGAYEFRLSDAGQNPWF